MPATTTTRTALIASLGRHLGSEFGTATGGTTTTLIDSSADSPLHTLLPNDARKGWWLYVNAGTHAGVERMVTASTGSSQTLTIGTVTGAVDTNDVYELHRHVSRSVLNELLNDALTEMCYYYEHGSPLTLVTDGDFEASGTSNWSATNATVTKNTTAGNVWNGTQSLSVVTTAADGYAQSDAIDVTEDERYRVFGWCRPDSASNVSSIVVRDMTNGANISITGTVSTNGADGNEWVFFSGTFTIPNGCLSIRVRLTDATNSSTTYWDDIIIRHQTRNWIDPASWVERWRLFEWVWAWIPYASPSLGRIERQPVQWCNLILNNPAVRNRTVEYSTEYDQYPLYISGLRYYSSLSSDTGTTTCDARWARAALAIRLFKRLRSNSYGKERDNYTQELAKWVSELRHVERPRRQYQPYGNLREEE